MTQFQIEKSRFAHLLTGGFVSLHTAMVDAGFEIRIVGGAVRDLLQGKEPKDIDVATNACPEQVMEVLDSVGIRHEPTGLQHGTITAVIDGEAIEITTLRIDSDHDGRHATVEFTNDWKLDAERRDLTFNAMSMTFDGTVFDFFGGAEDLKNNVARFVGSADARLKEDFLRMLRFFRFQGRFENPNWDEETLAVVKANAEGLEGVSGERVWSELKKVLSVSSRGMVCDKMRECNVLSFEGDNVFENVVGFDPVVAFSVLLKDMASVDAANVRMKFSRDEMAKLKFLMSNRGGMNMREFVLMLSNPKVTDDFVFALAETKFTTGAVAALRQMVMPVFPVTGADLLAGGMKPGKAMGAALNTLRAAWEQSDFQMTKDDLLMKE
jgi:hypothetical protein